MNKTIVTGHSRGLGASIAEELLKRDHLVLGVSRKRNAELGARYGDALQEVELDLADSAAVSRWLAGDGLSAFAAGAERILLVNNAGVVQPIGPLDLQQPEAVARAVTLNVAAPLMLASALVAATCEAGIERRVLHVSSGAGHSAYAGWSVYCATKAALDHHARCVVLDRTPALRICSLAPGVIDTDMQGEIRATTLERFPNRERFETLKREGSLASPEDCARRLADYLLSEGFGEAAVADLREVGHAGRHR